MEYQIHAENDGDLILVGRNQTKLDAQKKQVMGQYHIKAETIAVDLSNADAALQIYKICKENNWEIDILINNAGFGGQGFECKFNSSHNAWTITCRIQICQQMISYFCWDMRNLTLSLGRLQFVQERVYRLLEMINSR